MTQIKTFIELAIEGGWGGKCSNCQEAWLGHKQTRIGSRLCTRHPDIRDALLSPLAWQAVGKVKGWKEEIHFEVSEAEMKARKFLGQLFQGSSIEEALGEILK